MKLNPTIVRRSFPTRSTTARLTAALPSASGSAFPPRAHHLPRPSSHNLRRPFSTSPSRPSPSPSPKTPAELLAEYSELPTRTVKLTDLTRYGHPPLSEQALLDSAERTRLELLAGLAGRVTQHLSLPFLPSTNPSLHKIYELYYNAFVDLTTVAAPVRTLDDNDHLVEVIERMVAAHSDNIPILAKGFSECRGYLSASAIQDFLDRAIRNRISLRLMAEQHIQLSTASLPALRPDATPTTPPPAKPPHDRIGVLDLELSPYELIDSCALFVSELCEATLGVAPRYRIEGITEKEKVGSIGSHLEYILTELLKNAFRATVEHHTPKAEAADPDVFRFDDLPSAHLLKEDLPEVVISVGIVKGALTVRIRDRGGGVPPASLPNVFSYAFTSVSALPNPDADPDSPVQLSEEYGGLGGAGYKGGVGGGPDVPGNSPLATGMGVLAGLGFGLPLTRIYAAYFGGSCDLVSLTGWGTDAYVILRTVEEVEEGGKGVAEGEEQLQ